MPTGYRLDHWERVTTNAYQPSKLQDKDDRIVFFEVIVDLSSRITKVRSDQGLIFLFWNGYYTIPRLGVWGPVFLVGSCIDVNTAKRRDLSALRGVLQSHEGGGGGSVEGELVELKICYHDLVGPPEGRRGYDISISHEFSSFLPSLMWDALNQLCRCEQLYGNSSVIWRGRREGGGHRSVDGVGTGDTVIIVEEKGALQRRWKKLGDGKCVVEGKKMREGGGRGVEKDRGIEVEVLEDVILVGDGLSMWRFKVL
ncbi:hypothetical protein Tco_0275927 [Tanacetum coccineum]